MNTIIENFLGVFGTDTTTNFQLIRWAKLLKIQNFHYAMSDEVTGLPKSKLYAIINFQNSKQPGSHHVAYCIKDNEAYYFDSFGFYPPKEIEHFYKPLNISDYETQPYNTNMCGQLCLLFLYLMFHNFPYEDIILSMFYFFGKK